MRVPPYDPNGKRLNKEKGFVDSLRITKGVARYRLPWRVRVGLWFRRVFTGIFGDFDDLNAWVFYNLMLMYGFGVLTGYLIWGRG